MADVYENAFITIAATNLRTVPRDVSAIQAKGSLLLRLLATRIYLYAGYLPDGLIFGAH